MENEILDPALYYDRHQFDHKSGKREAGTVFDRGHIGRILSAKKSPHEIIQEVATDIKRQIIMDALDEHPTKDDYRTILYETL